MQTAQTAGFRLSPQQRRVWSLQRAGLAAGSTARAVVEVRGPLAPERLAGALREVVGAHEILRTRFVRLPGTDTPCQVVDDAPAAGVEAHDLRGLAPGEREREAARRSAALQTQAGTAAALLRLGDHEHRLVLAVPALCCDEAGIACVARAVAAAYSGPRRAADGEETPQYADLAEWMNAALEEGDEVEAGRSHWRGRGAVPDPELRLPLERRRSDPGAGRDAAPHAWEMEPAEWAAVASTAAALGVHPRDVLHAAWQALFLRLAPGAALPVGTLAAGRHYPELEELPGLFERWIPVGAEIPGPATFADTARATAERWREAEQWQDCFAWSDPAGLAAPSTFPLGFELREEPPVPGGGEVSFRLLRARAPTEAFRLALRCVRAGGGAAFELHFHPGHFEPASAALLAERFRTLLAGALAAPDAPLDALPLLGPAERRAVTRGADDPAPGPAGTVRVHEAFAAHAARVPGRVAVRSGDTSLTYAELDELSARLARLLVALGAGPERRVALLLESSAEMVAAILATLRAGGSYVPLDPAQPVGRTVSLIARAAPAAVVTLSHLAGPLAEPGCPVIRLDAGLLPDAGGAPPAPEVHDEGEAYVVYTSGSTGAPKGVAVTHGALGSYLRAAVERLELGEGLGYAMVSTFAADLGHTVLFPALCTGGTLHVLRSAEARDPAGMAAALSGRPADVLKVVPSHLAALLTAGDAQAATLLPRARLVLGGEAPRADLLARVRALAPGLRVFNHYGPTETTVGVAACELDGAGAEEEVPVGPPLRGVRAYVLDEALEPVPLEVEGELYVGGAQVARGYVGQPGATAERFLPDPYGPAGSRMYRTGDRVRRREDAALVFAGRADAQLKVRGYRVEPAEVEAVLEAHPGVEAAAVALRGEGARARLCAYLVPSTSRAAVLRRQLEMDRERALAGVPRMEVGGSSYYHLNEAETRAVHEEIYVRRTYFRHGVGLPARGAVVFDVGANVGLFSVQAGRESAGARVYAFEPMPPAVQALRANARLHGVDVRVHACGLAASSGEDEFTFYPRLSVLSGRHPDAQRERGRVRAFLLAGEGEQGAAEAGLLEELIEERLQERRYTVALRTVSEVLRESGEERVDLLKVDVQRSELEVLEGVEAEDWGRIRQVVVEVHDEAERPQRIRALLEGQGFRVAAEREADPGDQWVFWAVRPEDPVGGGAEREEEWRGAAALVEAVREHASGMLPDAMVPGAWMLLEALPLNANGKRDRGALPDPAGAERAHVAPRSPTEAALAEVWQEVLGVPWVGVTDDFFALGGHSLLALQLLARVRAALGVELALAQLLGDPTLGGVARAVDAGGAQGASPAPPPIRSVPRHGPLPLSFAQERLWFLQQMDPGDSSYVIPRVFRVRGPLDLRAMERTLAEVVRRHEVLRTTFPVVEGVPRQRVAAPEPLVLPVDDLSRLEPADREAALRRAVARELDRPFDLAAAPPLRVRCIRAGDGDHTLVLAAHHIAVDGVSMEVLAREISAIYPALAAGSPAPLPDPAVQYADYAVWQRGRLHGEALDRSLGWWTGQLAGVPAPAPFPGAAPADGPPPAARSCAAVLAADALRPLRALAAEEGATPFMALLAAFALALHRNTGQLDLCVGANASYRTEPELEGLVGLFLNQIVLRLDLSGDPTFRELLVRVRAASLGAYAHQEVPFERVVEAVRASRPGNAPLFRVKVDYQGTAGPDLDLPGLRIDLVEIPEGPAHGDLLLDLGDSCEDVTARVVWDPRAVAADVAGRILADTAALAEAAAASPDLAAGSLLDRLEAAEAERRGMQVKELEQATLGQLARLRSGARVRTSAGGSTQ